jgi:hypothetical protein
MANDRDSFRHVDWFVSARSKSSNAGMMGPEAGSTLRQANLAPDDIRGATG